MLVLVPYRGRKVHILRDVPGRPLPQAGNQVVWSMKCGGRAFGVARELTKADRARMCKRCVS